MARKFKKRGGSNRGQHRDNAANSGDWAEIEKENAKWENYYKNQLDLMTEEEFASFKAHMQRPLPLTFRITGTAEHANEVKKIFVEQHLPHLGDIEHEGVKIDAPKPLPFYPNELAWKVDISKQVIRRNEKFAKTQRFLVIETEVGNISRQEAVSMIPPLVLDVQPHHKVLDMCAAPGSKTAQLIEDLHKIPNPTGFVVANDADFKRAHMLVHQIKRLNSPNMVVVNHQAQLFPKTTIDNEYVKFDRILCDVPCSGDGTIRKNIQIWNKWGIGDGLGLNPLQYDILQRGVELLAKGGRLVYSTCSVNPMENEAVILRALRKNKNLRIVKTVLPGLVHSQGLKNWRVVGKDYEVKEQGSDPACPDHLYPPTEAEDFNLEDCIRVYPQQQNTGGFFITVLEKVNADGEKETATETQEPATKKFKKDLTQKKEKLSNNASDETEPFNFLSPEHPELAKCWEFFGFDKTDTALTECCFVRNATGEPTRNVYLSSPLTKQFLLANEERLKIVHSGVKLFVSQRTDLQCKWRIQNEALPILGHKITGARVLNANTTLFEKLLKEAFPKYDELNALDADFAENVKGKTPGCGFIKVKIEGHPEDIYPIWIGTSCINLMLSKKETFEALYRLFGVETTGKEEYKQTPTGAGRALGLTTETETETEASVEPTAEETK